MRTPHPRSAPGYGWAHQLSLVRVRLRCGRALAHGLQSGVWVLPGARTVSMRSSSSNQPVAAAEPFSSAAAPCCAALTGCEEPAAPLESTCSRSRLWSRLRSSIFWPSALSLSCMAAFLFLRLRFCRVDGCVSCIAKREGKQASVGVGVKHGRVSLRVCACVCVCACVRVCVCVCVCVLYTPENKLTGEARAEPLTD
jgi:hypothetical protein